MSLLPAYFSARRRVDESAPATEPAADPPDRAARGDPLRDDPLQNDVFGLLPPQPPAEAGTAKPDNTAEPASVAEPEPAPAAPSGRNVHPVAMADLSRLSIDNDGRLYWDGRPVEVRRRILMSRPQIVGASIIGLFVIVGAVGAAIHGSAAALDWACRLGWTKSYCALPDEGPPPPRRPDIPA